MNMHTQNFASLFVGRGCDTFEEAKKLRASIGVGSTFVPITGRDTGAGYHIEPDEHNVPLQNFNPPIEKGTEVAVTKIDLTRSSDISLHRDSMGGKLRFFPRVNVNVEYEGENTPPE